MKELTKNWKDIGFTVIAQPHSHWVDYTIYEIEGFSDDELLWHRKDSPCHPDPVETLEEAEVYAHGSVKWDGCSNWHFDEQERVMLHGCTRDDLTRLGEVLARCWDWNAELCERWSPC